MKIIFSFNKTNILSQVPPLFLKVRFLQVVINKPKHYALNERGGIKMPPQTTPRAPPAPPCPPWVKCMTNIWANQPSVLEQCK